MLSCKETFPGLIQSIHFTGNHLLHLDLHLGEQQSGISAPGLFTGTTNKRVSGALLSQGSSQWSWARCPKQLWFFKSLKLHCADKKGLEADREGYWKSINSVVTHSSWAGRVLFAWARSLWLENLLPRGSQTSAPAPWSQEGEWGTCRWPSPPGTAPCSRYQTALSSECPAASRAAKHRGGDERQLCNQKLQKKITFRNNMDKVKDETPNYSYSMFKWVAYWYFPGNLSSVFPEVPQTFHPCKQLWDCSETMLLCFISLAQIWWKYHTRLCRQDQTQPNVYFVLSLGGSHTVKI